MLTLDPSRDYTHVVYLTRRASGGWEPTHNAASAVVALLVRSGVIVGWWDGAKRGTQMVGMAVMAHMREYVVEV